MKMIGACLISLTLVGCAGIQNNLGTPTTTTSTSTTMITTSTQPPTTTSTYAAWKTNNRRIAGTQVEADFLDWLQSSGLFNMSSRIEEVGLVEEGLWFCRALDNGWYVENAFQRRVDLWLDDMSWLVNEHPEELDKMLWEAFTVMDAATHTLCPEHGTEFDHWIQSEESDG